MSFSDTLVHLFIPHHTNNHRSKILHLDALFAYVLIFALFNFGLRTLHKTMPDVLGYATDIHVEQLLNGTNAKRQEAGLSPLTINAQLSQAAAAKAQDMFAKGYWAHNSPSGATPWTFISGAGYQYVVAGENLAKNFNNSQGVVDAWMASPTHRENIVKSSYKEVGFAVVNGTLNGEETTLVVQMFGTSTGAVASAPVPTKAPVLVEKALATEEPAPAVKSAPPPIVTVVPTLPTVPAVAYPQPTVAPNFQSPFLGVTKTPAINIPTLTREIVFVFAGVLLGVLLLDAWIVSKKKIVRVAGHNIAHFLFLSAIVIIAGSVGRGALL
jgi:hypothetical protein